MRTGRRPGVSGGRRGGPPWQIALRGQTEKASGWRRRDSQTDLVHPATPQNYGLPKDAKTKLLPVSPYER